MRRYARFLLVICFSAALPASFAKDINGDNTWDKVHYLGGVPGVRVDRKHFEHILTLTPSKLIVMVKPITTADDIRREKEKPKLLFEIPMDSLIALTYSGFRHDMHSAQSWIGIPGKWPKATDHLIIVEYRLADGKDAEFLLRVDKKDFKEIRESLEKGIKAPSSSAERP